MREDVMKPGRTVTVCTGDVFAVREGQEKLVATMLVTMMTVGGPRDGSLASRAAGLGETDAHRQSSSRRWCPCRRLRTTKQRLGGALYRLHFTPHPTQGSGGVSVWMSRRKRS